MIRWNNSLTYLCLLVIVCLSAAPTFGERQTRRKAVQVPFEITNNLIVLQGRVNGSRPLSFILDTGASASVINESRAQELGLKLEGQTEATTQGGAIEASFAKGVSVRLAGLEFPGLTMAAIRLSGLEAGLGRNVDGILGYEIFKRYVVEINYATRVATFYEPQAYQYDKRGEVIPINIEDNTPFVRAKIAQRGLGVIEGEFLIDTGATGTLNLSSPFVTKNKLLEAVSGTVQITYGALLANSSSGRVGRLDSLRLGHFVVRSPVANLSQDTAGDDATTDIAGTIGGELLRRFTIITDYSRQRIILQANKDFSAPYRFDMSGMSLAAGSADYKTVKVRTLIADSPATEAGIKVGDLITAVDGRPVSALKLEQIRRMFREPGRSYLLNIKRNESLLRINLRTRRLI